jgi:hypothetical protein
MDGSPNLQLAGAQLVLDELLLEHLKRHASDSMDGLRNLVLQCGREDHEWTCASYMAGKSRGFRPLSELLRMDSIYTRHYYHPGEPEGDGMVMDYFECQQRYEELLSNENSSEKSFRMARQILDLLPDVETVQRCTIKRYRYERDS